MKSYKILTLEQATTTSLVQLEKEYNDTIETLVITLKFHVLRIFPLLNTYTLSISHYRKAFHMQQIKSTLILSSSLKPEHFDFEFKQIITIIQNAHSFLIIYI